MKPVRMEAKLPLFCSYFGLNWLNFWRIQKAEFGIHKYLEFEVQKQDQIREYTKVNKNM